MRKILSWLLSLVICICICSCANSDTTQNTDAGDMTTSGSVDTAATTNTADNVDAENQYKTAKEKLERYLESGYLYDDNRQYCRDNAALEYLYNKFTSLGDYKDSKDILSRFKVQPDLLTSITNLQVDNLGSEKETTYISYKYDKNGNVISDKDHPVLDKLLITLNRFDVSGSLEYEYDGDNIISIKVSHGYGAAKTLYATITPEYDTNGNAIKSTIKMNTDTYISTYTYDSENRITSAKSYQIDRLHNKSHNCDYTYQYDNKGNLIKSSMSLDHTNNVEDYELQTAYFYDVNNHLIKEEQKMNYADDNFRKDYTTVCEYEYDNNGYLVKLTKNDTLGSFTEFIYINDASGRPVSAQLTEKENGTNKYASQTLTYKYETLYFYNAE
jgi:hypothetical protein